MLSNFLKFMAKKIKKNIFPPPSFVVVGSGILDPESEMEKSGIRDKSRITNTA
jgi:hypothetical protein